jgi:hypothetical protein
MISKSLRFFSSLPFILLLSVVLRVAAALYLGEEVVSLPGTADQVSYHNLALRVSEGHGFSFAEAWWPVTGAGEPTAHWSYLYTFYLVLIYWIFGPHPLVARLIQAVIVGLIQPYLAYRLAGEVFNSKSGVPETITKYVPVISAAVTGIYLYFIYYSATLMTEAFFITALMGVMLVSLHFTDTITQPGLWKRAFWLGLTISIAILLRQLFLLFLPFLFAWLFVASWKRKAWRQALGSMAFASAILLVTILPITYYNYIRFDRFVLLNTNAGYVLFWANHPIHGAQFIPASEMGKTYQKLVPPELRSLDEAALDQELLKLGVNYIISQPGRYLLLSISRIPEYFKFWPEPASGIISNLVRVGSFGLFLPFIFYGIVRSSLFLRRAAAHPLLAFSLSPVGLLYLFILIYTTIHILTWTLVRYRLPVDAFLILFAGLALAELISYLGWVFKKRMGEDRMAAAEGQRSSFPVRQMK